MTTRLSTEAVNNLGRESYEQLVISPKPDGNEAIPDAASSE